MTRDGSGGITRVRYVLPRHTAANWVGPGRGRKTTRPGANGVVELSPFEFLDRLADLVPPPRKHRHRYHGVSAPNHRLRRAVTALAIGNIGKRREAATGGQANDGHGTGGGGVSPAVPGVRRRHPADCVHHRTRASDQTTAGRSRPTSNRRFASGRRPGWLRPRTAAPPPVSPARGPPTDWGELVQAHDDRDVFQVSPDELPVIDIHTL